MKFFWKYWSRFNKKIHDDLAHLNHAGQYKGNVLISYSTICFWGNSSELMKSHTNRYESYTIAKVFQERGYDVDVIDFENNNFIPKKKYKFFLDVGTNIERLEKYLNKDCVKIFHATTSYFEFNNKRELERFANLRERRKVHLKPDRLLPESRSENLSDIILLLGNGQTKSTYEFLHKEIYTIPLSSLLTFPFNENKDIDLARKNVVWISGAGLVHKGLDILLEAFAKIPDYKLHLVGKTNDKDFLEIYKNEISLPNIINHGFLDLSGESFNKILGQSLFVVSASCSEGQSGSVIMGMHGGLIPIITKETGIDVFDFGLNFKDDTIDTVINTFTDLKNYSNQTLRTMSRKSHSYVNQNHTREKFRNEFENFVKYLEKKYE